MSLQTLKHSISTAQVSRTGGGFASTRAEDLAEARHVTARATSHCVDVSASNIPWSDPYEVSSKPVQLHGAWKMENPEVSRAGRRSRQTQSR